MNRYPDNKNMYEIAMNKIFEAAEPFIRILMLFIMGCRMIFR